MALAYTNAYKVMTDPTLTEQVTVAMLNYSGTVIAESGATTDHTNRINLAYAVIKNPAHYAALMLQLLIAENAGTLTMDANGQSITLPDATVLSNVAGQWNSLADALASPIS